MSYAENAILADQRYFLLGLEIGLSDTFFYIH